MKKTDELKDALYKRAKGLSYEEVTEEYAHDGEGSGLKLVKRKITSKYSPPDISAARALIAMDGEALEDMTDGQLELEKARLIALLKEGAPEKLMEDEDEREDRQE